MKSTEFHGKDFICIGSDGKYSILVVDHEIHQISWNLADFMKSGGFHGKDLYICIGSDEKYSLLVVDHEIQ